MAIDPDVLIDRGRLKRQLSIWRVIAVAAVLLAVLVGLSRLGLDRSAPHVGRLRVTGIITDDGRRDEALAKAAKDDRVRALLVYIDSPGGTVVGGEALYAQLRSFSAKKPVVAVMGEVATSAAYMTALGSDRIFARGGSITGSVGVLLQTADLTGLLQKFGIKPETIKSGALKAQPNPLESFTPEAREVTRDVVLNIFQSFIDLVRERRQLAPETMQEVATGRVYTGRQAVENGLIDALGGEAEARGWLKERFGIDENLPMRDVKYGRPEETILSLFSEYLGTQFLAERAGPGSAMAVWRPLH